MDAIKCDGCKRVSPDDEGLHIANSWAKVTVWVSKTWKDYHLCEMCLPTEGSVHGLASKLLAYFRRKP